MDSPIANVPQTCANLRQSHASILAPMPQSDVVTALSQWVAGWKDPRSPWRREAETLAEPFPFAMTRISLEALLDSLTPKALWELIDAEQVRETRGAPLIGHVIAGNTPLLAWVSILRALLMRSASFVKLPSGGAADWGRLFLWSLAETAPPLASCVHLAQWPGGTPELDTALCQNSDLILAYGSQSTIEALQALCPPGIDFHGYGPRVSFGLVLSGAPLAAAARGFARDVLLYDQGGCLSPHTIFVEGDWPSVVQFAGRLADALREAITCYPLAARSPCAAARVQEARTLARMGAGTVLWEDPYLRWTVIARNDKTFAVSPTHGIISVQPLLCVEDLPAATAPVAGQLQGCAIALPSEAAGGEEWQAKIERLGVSWICRPGQLQAPPLSWREDGKDVLQSLRPASTFQ